MSAAGIPTQDRGLRILGLFPDGPDAPGGIARYTRSVLHALERHPRVGGVELLVRRGGHSEASRGSRIRVRRSATRTGFALRALANAMKGFDLVLCGHLHYAALARAAAVIAGARMWALLYGIEAWDRPPDLRLRAVQHCDQLIAISRYTRARVLDWAAVESWRCRVLPPAVELAAPGTQAAADPRTPARDGAPVLLSVSRLDASEAYKGHDTVIRAMNILATTHPEVRYEVVGEGDDRPRLEALCASEGVADRVCFTGHLPDADLARSYATADVFVMPSEGEGFGIVFIEALAAGLRVIAGDCAGSVDALRDGELGELVATRDPEALARAVTRALARPRINADLSCFSEAAFGRRLCGLVDEYLCRRGEP